MLHELRFILVALLLLVLPALAQEKVAGPAGARVPSVTLPPELDRVLRDYEKAWKAGDAAGLTALFAEDGFVLANGKPPIRGREAIRAGYAGASGDLRLRALAFSVEEEVGFIIGAFGIGEAATTTDQGKFILALTRSADGPWLIAADMDNGNPRDRH